MASLTYEVRGKGTVKLLDKDFVSSGGEGKIYRKNNTVYKIYLNPKRMIPILKIDELSSLTLNNIINPKEIIQDNKGNPIGFTMGWVPNNVAMCRLFTNDFRNKNGITPDIIVKLVDAIQEGIVFIHDKKCLIVDGNEMNYLVDGKTFSIPYFIDVDSYQTPNFKATALMPSIKDWHTNGFNTLTDWFAFGIIACQLFVGIHPYKGKHPAFQKKDIEERMKKNISIFNSDVSLPSATRDFSYIPSKMKEWFTLIFEKGERIPPPQVAGLLNITPITVTLIQNTDNFIIKRLETYKSNIIKYFTCNGKHITVTQNALFIDKADYPFGNPNIDVIFTKKQLKPIAVEYIDDSILLHHVGELYDKYVQGIDKRITFPLSVSKKMVVKNTLYTIYEGKITEIVFNEIGNNILVSTKSSWDIMPQSSQVFDNVIYQDVLGKGYLVIPEPEDYPLNHYSQCHVKAISELDGYRVINAKHDDGVCMVIGHKNGKFDKIILRFDQKYANYHCRILEDVDQDSINFTVTPTNTAALGLAISINDDSTMEIFPRDPNSMKMKVIKDTNINTSMRLCKAGTRVLFWKNKSLYSLKMK